MFAKPFKVKSNNNLKNSEKKVLIQRIVDEFPAATEELAKELVPTKASCSCMKVVLHSGEAAEVYVVNGAPLLLAARGALLPTVAALWRAPGLLPALAVHDPVLAKIQKGAPLYLPGMVLPAGAALPLFARGAALALRTPHNAAAAAVGRAAMASGDMLLKSSGMCMEVLHWVGDMLCREHKFGRLERPQLGPPGPPAAPAGDQLAEQLAQMSIPQEEWPALGHRPLSAAPAPASAPAASVPASAPARRSPPPAAAPADPADPADPAPQEDSVNTDDDVSVSAGAPADMDGLLRWALLSFLKLRARSVQLPLLASLLYRNYLLPLCPPGRTLDVKKSSYKKVGKFLEAMQKEGLLQVRELEKGVDAVTALNAADPRVRAHAPPPLGDAPAPPAAPAPDDDHVTDYTPPLVREVFSVTAAVTELLAPLKKGTTLSAAELRSALTEYVRTRQLTSREQKGAVVLDATLARVLQAREQEHVKWDALMSGVQSKLTACTEMRFADGRCSLARARLHPVTMQVAVRSGNKKVTLVSNLEAFGFCLRELARTCQRGAAAAGGVTRAPGARSDQLLLQGDQTYYVAKLLIEKYGLPKKYVEGADKALKKKKGS